MTQNDIDGARPSLSTQNTSDKPAGYFDWAREHMLEFIPNTARRVLDVGCGAGTFGKLLKQSGNMEVWGIELDKEAAAKAALQIDHVHQGEVSATLPLLPKRYFDCIVFNDILEHLVDPYSVLQEAKAYLNHDGVVVCSIPNIRYYATLYSLLFHKQWRYEDGGILDRTHLRFFTERSIRDMFSELNYDINKMKGINRAKSKVARLANTISLGWISDTLYYQFGCQVKPRA